MIHYSVALKQSSMTNTKKPKPDKARRIFRSSEAAVCIHIRNARNESINVCRLARGVNFPHRASAVDMSASAWRPPRRCATSSFHSNRPTPEPKESITATLRPALRINAELLRQCTFTREMSGINKSELFRGVNTATNVWQGINMCGSPQRLNFGRILYRCNVM